jgi:hypothetical protein
MISQFLDASLAGLAEILIILFMIAVTLIEAVVMVLFKLNKFGKCLLDSFLVNVASLVVGFLISTFYNINLGGNSYLSLVIGFIASVLVEGLLLQLLNRKTPAQKIWQVDIVMNVVTYIGMLIIFIQ